MKRFNYQRNIGKAKHVISHHDGSKTHSDGSPFFDVAVFGNAKKASAFMLKLRKSGYTEASR